MRLKKEITFIGIFSIATGAMISSGIFILPGIAYAKIGPLILVSYLLAGVFALIGILSTIELSTAMPKAGGDYFFINKTLGPLMGTIAGLLGWLALSLKSAFAIFGIAEILYLFTKINPTVLSFFLCIIFLILNIVGVKETVKFQIFLVVGLFSLIVIYILVGFFKIESQMLFSTLRPYNSKNILSILSITGFIFISFGGLLKIASVSEEIKNPKKILPIGIISSIIVVTISYVFMLIVAIGTLKAPQFAKSLTPIADSAKIIMGTPGFVIISFASMLAFVTTANAGIMSASRYPLALSRDGLLPKFISGIGKKYHTPITSILLTGIVIFFSLLLPLEELVKIASTIILSSYVLTNLSVIVLRESKLVNYKPSFKAPFYPWLQILSIGVFSFFIIDLGVEAVEIVIAFLILCILLYFLYGKRHKRGDYAFLYLLKRIVDKNITGNLEDELKDILRNRDSEDRD